MKMQVSHIFVVVLVFSLVPAANAEIPFVISYYDDVGDTLLPITSEYSELAACGINVVNDSLNGISLYQAQANGMQCMVNWGTGGWLPFPFDYSHSEIDARAQTLVNVYSSHPALLGYRLTDEPHVSEFSSLAYAHQKLLELDPNCLPWVNLYPNYATSAQLGVSTYDQYVDNFMTVVQPKVLCYDNYSYDNNNHFSNMETIRHYGLQHDVPYWSIFQSAPYGNNPDPTEGKLRWQMYSALAYGYTGLIYFTYSTFDNPNFGDKGDALIDIAGNPTSKYYMAQDINAEIMNLAPVLNKLTSQAVYHSTPVPTGANGLASNFVAGISGGQAVLGELADDSERIYLFFINREYAYDRNYTVQLNPANVAGLGRMDKNTGKLVLVNTAGNTLSLSLAPGDGELFKVLLDTTASSVPTGLDGEGISSTQIDLDWNAAFDGESGIDYYSIYRNNEEIGTSTSLFFSDIDLLPDTRYLYRIAAVNGEGLESGKSLPILVRTLLDILLPGDANQDGIVDVADLGILTTNYGAGSGFGWDDGDFTGDSIVDVSDLGVLATNYGVTGGAVVPEPDMLVLLASMLLMVGARKKKRMLTCVTIRHKRNLDMKSRNTLLSLIAVGSLLPLGQAVKAEVPFMINYFDGTTTLPVNQAGYSQLGAANFTTVNSRSYHDDLDLAQANGLKVMVDLYEWGLGGSIDGFTSTYIEQRTIAVTQGKSDHPAFSGVRIRDEPSADEFDELALAQERFLYYDALYDGKPGPSTHVPWVNLHPIWSYGNFGTATYKEYIESFINTVQPRVLSYDEYTAASYNPGDRYIYHANLKSIRRYGLANNIPYQRCILSTQLPGYNNDPDEGILRYQAYSSLAYGYTGITYFNYWSWDHYINQGAAPALVNLDGTPDAKYYYAQAINNEMQNLAPTLQKLTSTGVYLTNAPSTPDYVNGNLIPSEDKEYFSSGVDGTYVTNISGGHMVEGVFTDDTGRPHFMLVNDDDNYAHNFTINLSGSIPNLGRYNKNNGKLEVVSTTGNVLTLNNMKPGNGELFKILLDTTASSVPTGLDGEGISSTQIDLDWNAAFDGESGIDYYGIYRNNEEIGTSTSLSFSDIDLLPDTSYIYRITAVNGEGLESAKSLPILVRTLLDILLPGDANEDGIVDVSDLGILATNYGAGSGFGWSDADFTGDGVVDVSDLGVLATNYGTTSYSVSVPESSMFVGLLGLCLAGFFVSTRRSAR